MSQTYNLGNEDYDNYPGIQYPYSAKAEQTSKGVRLTVHCHGYSEEEVRDSVLRLYLKLGQDLVTHGVNIAPTNTKENEASR